MALSIIFYAPLGISGADATSAVKIVAVGQDARPVAAKLDAEGTIHVLYNSDDGPRYAKSTDGGESWSAAIPVVDEQARKPGLVFEAADLAVGKNGRVHVAMSTNAWKLKLPENEWAFFYATLAPGANSFSPTRNLNHQPSEGFSLAADTKGNVTACWLSDKLYASVSHDDGATFDAAREIDAQFNPCNCCTTNATYGKDGRLAVLYREETNDERDMYVVLWDQKSDQVSRHRISTTLWKVDACPMSYYTITAKADGGYLAIWPTKENIYFAHLDSEGRQRQPGEIKTSGTFQMRTGVLALPAEDGTTLVVWKNKGQLHWQPYDSDGHSLAKPTSASSVGTGVAGVVTKDGKFLLVR